MYETYIQDGTFSSQDTNATRSEKIVDVLRTICSAEGAVQRLPFIEELRIIRGRDLGCKVTEHLGEPIIGNLPASIEASLDQSALKGKMIYTRKLVDTLREAYAIPSSQIISLSAPVSSSISRSLKTQPSSLIHFIDDEAVLDYVRSRFMEKRTVVEFEASPYKPSK
jgi:hypothetical protein